MRWLHVTIRDIDDETLILAEKWVRICKVGLPQNEALLRWLNSKGGFDAWVFNNLRSDNVKHQNTVSYTRYAERVRTIVKRDATLELILKANDIPQKQIEGLQTLFQSNQVYLDDLNGFFTDKRTVKQDTYIPVFINETSINIYETGTGVYSVDFTLNLLNING